MRALFVTGAEGVVGQRLVRRLKACGHDVTCGVRNRARKLAYEREQFKALVCDVADSINVARAVAVVRPDGVVHLAGPSDPALAKDDPLLAYQTIVSAWANVLDAVRRTVPRARVVLASAADVYGTAVSGSPPFAESAALRPTSAFGELKAAAESIARTYHREYHLNISIARPFRYLGAGAPTQGELPRWLESLQRWDATLNGPSLRVDDGEDVYDWLHVDDVVTAYEAILHRGQPNATYNVCSGSGRTRRELVEQLAATAGLSVRVIAAGEGAPRTLVGSNERLRQELGWAPTRTVDQGLAELWQRYQTQAPSVATVAL